MYLSLSPREIFILHNKMTFQFSDFSFIIVCYFKDEFQSTSCSDQYMVAMEIFQVVCQMHLWSSCVLGSWNRVYNIFMKRPISLLCFAAELCYEHVALTSHGGSIPSSRNPGQHCTG